jgi:hypothetical protein
MFLHNTYIIVVNCYSIRDKIVSLFHRLKLNIHIPLQIHAKIDSNIPNPHFSETISDDESSNNSDNSDLNYRNNMAQSPIDFLRLAAQTINKNYSGDPLALDSFINSVQLLETIVTNDNKDLLKQYIITKLEGKALEAVPNNPETIEIIKNALKQNIRPDNSKVIEGRMLALKHDNMTNQDFAKTAEDLADALRRTLIVEGISQAKANEMAIDRTVEMCRSTTRSNLVKSVLASSHFSDAKNVIAKFLVETNTDVKEKQILAYRTFRGHEGYRNNNRGRGHYHQINRRFRGSYNGNRGNYSSHNNNNFHFNPRNHNQGNQQRGNYRGQRTFHTNNRYANVRYTESGNSEPPQQRGLGELLPNSTTT